MKAEKIPEAIPGTHYELVMDGEHHHEIRQALARLHKAALAFWVGHGAVCEGGRVCDEMSAAMNHAGFVMKVPSHPHRREWS